MSIYHDEVEIEDFEYDEETETYYYPCPCGDRFEVTKEQLESGEDVGTCPSCSLIVKVIYDPDTFIKAEVVTAASSVKSESRLRPKSKRYAGNIRASNQSVLFNAKTKMKATLRVD